ncbi:MAG: NUDIX domain-containing protein [Bacteroidia bacterium]|nr:NUDIX domain-containing protein [Bacteroidia bacterium]
MFLYNFCPTCKSELELLDDGYQHCVNTECNYIHYGNPIPVVAAIIEYGEEQVLLAHNVAWPEKWYALITGFLEKGEHPEYAVVREVKEETNLDCEIGSFIGHYTFRRMNQIILAYHVKAWGDIQLNEELDDYKLVPFGKVKTWPGGTGKALKHFLESKGYEVEEIPFN